MATVERVVTHVPTSERAKRIVLTGRVLAVVVPIVLWFAPLPLAQPAQKAIAIGSSLIIGWITEALDPALIGLIGCFLYWALGVVSFETAFSGFVDTTAGLPADFISRRASADHPRNRSENCSQTAKGDVENRPIGQVKISNPRRKNRLYNCAAGL
jgi:hypothetical protein